MSVLLDLSDFSGLDIEIPDSDIFEVVRNSAKTVSFIAKDGRGSYGFFRIPGELPVGAMITVTCESRNVSGAPLKLGIGSYTDSGYVAGFSTESTRICSASSEYTISSLVCVVRPGHQHIAVNLGMAFVGAGENEVRSFHVEIGGVSMETLNPCAMAPVSFSRQFSVSDINREWVSVKSPSATLTRLDDKIVMAADKASGAYVMWAESTGWGGRRESGLKNVSGSAGFSVDVKGLRRSGFPSISADYYNEQNSRVAILKGYFFGVDDGWSRFWFPPILGVDFVNIAIGFASTNAGDFDLKGVRVTQYNSESSRVSSALNLFCCKIKKTGGSWAIDNDHLSTSGSRFVSAGIRAINANANDLFLSFDDYSGALPIMSPSLDDSQGEAGNYYAVCDLPTSAGVSVRFYDRSTKALVPVASMPNDVYVSIIGIGVH